MSIRLERVAEKDRVAKKLSDGTRKEYRSTLTQWLVWGQGVDVDRIERQRLRDFLDRVHEKATQDGGANAGPRTRPGTTSEPSYPGPGSRTTWRSCPGSPSPSRSATPPVGTTSRRRTGTLSTFYFATYERPRPRGWDPPFTVGRHCGQPWWYSSISVSTRGRCSSRPAFTSRFYAIARILTELPYFKRHPKRNAVFAAQAPAPSNASMRTRHLATDSPSRRR